MFRLEAPQRRENPRERDHRHAEERDEIDRFAKERDAEKKRKGNPREAEDGVDERVALRPGVGRGDLRERGGESYAEKKQNREGRNVVPSVAEGEEA